MNYLWVNKVNLAGVMCCIYPRWSACFLGTIYLGKGGGNKILVSEDQGHLLISFCVIITLYILFAFEMTSYKGEDECFKDS